MSLECLLNVSYIVFLLGFVVVAERPDVPIIWGQLARFIGIGMHDAVLRVGKRKSHHAEVEEDGTRSALLILVRTLNCAKKKKEENFVFSTFIKWDAMILRGSMQEKDCLLYTCKDFDVIL